MLRLSQTFPSTSFIPSWGGGGVCKIVGLLSFPKGQAQSGEPPVCFPSAVSSNAQACEPSPNPAAPGWLSVGAQEPSANACSCRPRDDTGSQPRSGRVRVRQTERGAGCGVCSPCPRARGGFCRRGAPAARVGFLVTRTTPEGVRGTPLASSNPGCWVTSFSQPPHHAVPFGILGGAGLRWVELTQPGKPVLSLPCGRNGRPRTSSGPPSYPRWWWQS